MLRRSHRSWSTHSKRGRGICASHSETWSCQEKDKFEAVKEDIKVYTAMWGHCPSELGSLHFDDPYTQSFTYGLGCNIKALCHCQHNPILTCATNSYVWKIPDAVEPFTKTFGYCRVAPWVFITLAGLGVLLIALIIFCARKRRALG
ncbi:unnamed protein product [Cladocopium goreaui]|uniref:Uncharacterized protein n=1 Tax=Cladocopium goreaui TaxID=2562237 RepID=A0A9P1BL91_9DINO|nr:unnamed protein product [Cladocopium goreaui]